MGIRAIRPNDAATASIVSGYSSGTPARTTNLASIATAKKVLSGALTANNLATILTITGAGWLDLLVAGSEDGTSRSVRCKLIIDGVTAFDSTTSDNTTVGGIPVVSGIINTSLGTYVSAPARFNQSVVVQVATSVASETDKVSIHYMARTE